MEKIGEAIIAKVRADAQNIVIDAEKKAQEEIDKAKRQREERLEEEKRKMIEEAEEEAARILAQASMKARQELLSVKTDIIANVMNKVKKGLSQSPTDKNLFSSLIKEAVDGLGGNKARIYASPKDMSIVRNCLEEEEVLANKVMEVKEGNFWGGIIAEDIDGKLRIDNTYETRLEMLLPKILPDINKKIFEPL